MILDYFIAAFKARFPDRSISVTEAGTVATIAGANQNVGNIEVQDDLDELIVFIGDITHGHFDCYDNLLSEEEKRREIASDVLDFLADVFADKIEFYRGEHGGGGWRPAGSGPGISFTWSGIGNAKHLFQPPH